MINRVLGVLALAAMLAANALLLWHDVWPQWCAGPPPQSAAAELPPGSRRTAQYGLFVQDRRIGRAWSVAEKRAEVTDIRQLTLLDAVQLPHGVMLPVARLDMQLRYQSPEMPLSLDLEIQGLPVKATLEGRAFAGDFGCEWRFGELHGSFVVPADTLRAMGDSLRPFDRLPGLHVGQTWQMRLVNPMPQVLPGFGGRGPGFESVLVKVTGRETIAHPHDGHPVEVFVVEAPPPARTKAYVADDGQVLRQEVDMPLVGRIVVLDEPFNPEMYNEAATRVLPGGADERP